MSTQTPEPEALCGNTRPNCRYLLGPDADPKSTCQQHTAWCADEQCVWQPIELSEIRDQRVFRTGSW